MYIYNFISSLNKKHKIPILIYLVLNVIIISWIISIVIRYASEGTRTPNFFLCLFWGIVLYAVSVAIALSPVGEWILRLQCGCKKIKSKEQIAIIEPIFNEVYSKAKELNPELSDEITIYVKPNARRKNTVEEEGPNAFAAGRNTICVTESLLAMPKDQIKAVLGHEFGHLAHHDTDIVLVVTVGNMIISAIISILVILGKILGIYFEGVSEDKQVGCLGIPGLLAMFFFLIAVNIFNRVWTQIGVWLCMKTSRDNEYLADEFSFNLGYGVPLCKFLDEMAGDNHAEGVFAALSSSHPNTSNRIARLQGLGCEYNRNN